MLACTLQQPVNHGDQLVLKINFNNQTQLNLSH